MCLLKYSLWAVPEGNVMLYAIVKEGSLWVCNYPNAKPGDVAHSNYVNSPFINEDFSLAWSRNEVCVFNLAADLIAKYELEEDGFWRVSGTELVPRCSNEKATPRATVITY